MLFHKLADLGVNLGLFTRTLHRSWLQPANLLLAPPANHDPNFLRIADEFHIVGQFVID